MGLPLNGVLEDHEFAKKPTTMNYWMESLNTATQHLWCTGYFRDITVEIQRVRFNGGESRAVNEFVVT